MTDAKTLAERLRENESWMTSLGYRDVAALESKAADMIEQQASELEKLARCGRENCMGWRADGVAQWVREELLLKARREIEQQAAEIAALRAEREALKADAERYRGCAMRAQLSTQMLTGRMSSGTTAGNQQWAPPLTQHAQGEPVALCTYPYCAGNEPADSACCRAPFTSAMAEAAEKYWRAVGPSAHPLPAQFRWVECYRAMLYAAPPAPQQARNPWREAIDEALVVAHLGVATEPYDDLNKLLQWHHDIWLDPCVSSDAQALIDRGRQEAQPSVSAEPVAWHVCSVNSDGSLSLEHAAAWEEAAHEHINDAINEDDIEDAATWVVRPVYYHPPPASAPYVPLSDEQIDSVSTSHGSGGWQTMSDMRRVARAIERIVIECVGGQMP